MEHRPGLSTSQGKTISQPSGSVAVGGREGFFQDALQSLAWIPPAGSGPLKLCMWAHLLGVDESTVYKWVVEFAIPHRRIARSIWIEPGDFWNAMPLRAGKSEDNER